MLLYSVFSPIGCDFCMTLTGPTASLSARWPYITGRQMSNYQGIDSWLSLVQLHGTETSVSIPGEYMLNQMDFDKWYCGGRKSAKRIT